MTALATIATLVCASAPLIAALVLATTLKLKGVLTHD